MACFLVKLGYMWNKGNKQTIHRRRSRVGIALRRLLSFRPHRKSNSAKSNPRRSKILLLRIRKFIILTLFLLVAGGLVYTVIRSVLLIKETSDTDESLITEESTGDIVGIPGIPMIPGSVFMFKQHINEDIVQEFLADGGSAYVLPTDTDWEEVVSFYEEKLPERGWEQVLQVDRADRERLHGEYWVFKVTVAEAEETEENASAENVLSDDANNSDDSSNEVVVLETSDQIETNSIEIDTDNSYGIRIYNKAQAVWYARISYEDALTGLAGEVEKEKEIDLILAMGSTVDLPESFPWKLSYPELWHVEIRESLLIDAPLAEFSGADSEGMLTIEPVVFDTGKTLEEVGGMFLQEVNGRRSVDEQFSIDEPRSVVISGHTGLVYELISGNDKGFLAFVVHPDNGIVYSITSLDGEESFFNFIIETIEVRE